MPAAIGLIEVEGIAGIIVAADAAVKSADVELLGWESIGGFTTVFFSGSISDVDAALKSGAEAARQVVEHVVAAPVTQPQEACLRFVSFPVQKEAEVKSGALGLIETRGYGAHIYADDEMVKTAAVDVVNVLTVHNRVVCSLVQGDVGAVREAIARAEMRLADYDHLMCSAVLPQPRPEVLQAFAVPMGGNSGV
jgi:carbon dioxide concentrating mechanism protein CcmO